MSFSRETEFKLAFASRSVISNQPITIMKKLLVVSTLLRRHLTGIPGLVVMAAGLGSAFFFVTANTGVAQGAPQQCEVCHKGQETLSLPCDGEEHKRHLAHGDAPNACPPKP